MAYKFNNSTYLSILICILCFSITKINAQEQVLDKYVNQALESNISLKQNQLSYEKSLYTLKEAKRMFFPTISLVGEYSFNEGGRTISLPLGDMINPVYENLNLINQINTSQNPDYPNIPEYPSVENSNTPLNPEQQQITFLNITIPVFNAAYIYNKKLQNQLSNIEHISIELFKKELIKDVKTGYLDYISLLEKIEVIKKALEVGTSNLNVTNSLYKNDKVTVDEVYKSEAKVKEIKNKIIDLEKAEILSKAYFNFLLNRKYNKEIIVDENSFKTDFTLQSLDELINIAINNRYEIQLQDKSIQLDETMIKLQKGGALPIVEVEGNAGYWSEDYTFSNKTDYATLAFSFKWELFSSGQRKSKIQQAKVDKLIDIEKRKNLENNIAMEVIEAWQNVKSAKESIALSELEVKNYKASFDIIEKKKAQGRASQLEYDAAFTNYYESEINLLNNKNIYYQKIIELEYSINK